MSDKKTGKEYKSYNSRSRSTSSRGSSQSQSRQSTSARYSQRGQQDSNKYSYERQREHDRARIRRRSRGGCLVAVGLFVVVLIGLYFIIFKSSLFNKDNTQIKNETPTPSFTQYIETTPTPTLKPQATAIPTPTLEPMSTIGYVSTADEDGVVNIREEPNGTGKIVGELHNREVLYLMDKIGEYYKIRHRGEIVYVYANYIVEHLPEDNMLCDVITYEISKSNMVNVLDIVPTLMVEMPYATESNHVNKQMYPFELVLLQETTAYKLKRAQEMFLEDGYCLVIWDAYRPFSVTYENFQVIQDPRLAADPSRGSNHNRGAAVDVTLFDIEKNEYVDTPTQVREMNYDLAKRSSSSMTYEQRKNMEYMERIMGQAGFSPYQGEWWHYNDNGALECPVLDIQFESWEN